jgi:hypothetical protein
MANRRECHLHDLTPSSKDAARRDVRWLERLERLELLKRVERLELLKRSEHLERSVAGATVGSIRCRHKKA